MRFGHAVARPTGLHSAAQKKTESVSFLRAWLHALGIKPCLRNDNRPGNAFGRTTPCLTGRNPNWRCAACTGVPVMGAAQSALVLGALGVVYGDIGTSPLYTLKTAYQAAGGYSQEVALGLLSLIVWTLIIVTSVKYVALVMRADNDGEGGILALMAHLALRGRERPAVVAVGILGAALLYGDGAITPAISVLSALEGLKTPAPAVAPYVLPLAVLILLALFAVQRHGTAVIGRLFGPVMVVWFLTIAVLGIAAVAMYPGVLRALWPGYGIHYLATHGFAGFSILGAVFLCATGAEALYADMGHFGAKPIRVGWYGLVFPCLVLSYAGQTAYVLDRGLRGDDNPFFLLAPAWAQLPMVALATVATVIASQAIISGVFSMTRQAIQLDLCPRLSVTQTSAVGYGQIYIGSVNWMLMLFTIGLTWGLVRRTTCRRPTASPSRSRCCSQRC
jgi:KUP system potassium uptake protein